MDGSRAAEKWLRIPRVMYRDRSSLLVAKCTRPELLRLRMAAALAGSRARAFATLVALVVGVIEDDILFQGRLVVAPRSVRMLHYDQDLLRLAPLIHARGSRKSRAVGERPDFAGLPQCRICARSWTRVVAPVSAPPGPMWAA